MIPATELFLPTHAALAQLSALPAGEGVPLRCSKCGNTSFITGPIPDEPLPSAISDLQSLQDRIAAWQERTFPDQPLAGKLNHLVREARELRADPAELEEWADVLILLLGAAAKYGLTVQDLLVAAECKFSINQKRQWGQADSQGVYHHIG